MKLTLRDLLWLILAAAIALSWWQSDRKRAAELRTAIESHHRQLDKFRMETAETLNRYRQAAFDNPGFREFVQQHDRDLAAYRDFIDRRKSAGQTQKAGAGPPDLP